MRNLHSILISACVVGGAVAASVGTVQADTNSGYIWFSPSSVVIAQLTISGNHISGAWHEVDENTQDFSLHNRTYSVNGLKSGTSIHITIGNTWQYSGSLTGGKLLLSVPQADGTLATVKFTAGSVTRYNADVKTLQQNAQSQQALSDSVNQIDHDNATFNFDKTMLDEDMQRIGGEYKDSVSKLADETQSLNTVEQYEHSVLNDVKNGTDSSNDFQMLNGYMNEIWLDSQQIQNDSGSVQEGEVDEINADVKTYQSDYSKLVSDAKKLPFYHPSPSIPSASSVNKFVQSVQTTVAKDAKVITENGATETSLNNQAQQCLKQAQDALNVPNY